MTLETFLVKLGGVGLNLLLLFGYLGIRALMRSRKYFFTATNQEYEALRKGDDETKKDLIAGIWGANTAKVTSYASFGLGTVVLAAVFIYEQKFVGYEALFFYILISIVAISMLSYFLSLQLWFLVMDVGGSVETKILYRKQATFFQVVGWYAIHLSIILAILAVNTVAGYIVSFINMSAAVYLIELKAIVALREQADSSEMNEFQKSLDIDTIYEKNEDVELVTYQNKQLRILNWNIERGYDPDQLIKYIKSVDPDIVALQEVDWGNERTGEADVLEYIARETGMMGYFGIEFFEIETPYRNAKMAGGGVHGNAILTKIKPVSVYRVELPIQFDWENPPLDKAKIARTEKRIGSRFALCADFQAGNSLLTVCSVHLEDKHGGVDGRLDQFNTLTKALDKNTNQPHAFVIAGDMNTLDNWLARLFRLSSGKESVLKPWNVSECAWWMKHVLPETEYRDPFTCKDWTLKKTWLYKEKLDWMLVRHAKVTNKGIGDFNSSDHRPIWIDITPIEK